MVGQLLLRGMLAGVLAGLLAFAFAYAFGEPSVDRAIAFEEERAAAKGEAPEPELVGREVQSTLGLLTGTLAYGAGVGGFLGLVFAFAYGRVGALGARELSALLALAGFIAVVLAPFVKYPANPPSIGDPDTIGYRTALYFTMMAVSVAGMTAAVVLGRRLVHRLGTWNGVLVAGLGYLVAMAAVQLLLPPVNEVPEEFSAVVLWQFRASALGIHLVLWTTLGLAFGALVERSFAPRTATARRAYG